MPGVLARRICVQGAVQQHTGKVCPSSSIWSKPSEVTPHTIGLGMQLVASSLPPTPTSRMATSTFSSRNTFKAVTSDHCAIQQVGFLFGNNGKHKHKFVKVWVAGQYNCVARRSRRLPVCESCACLTGRHLKIQGIQCKYTATALMTRLKGASIANCTNSAEFFNFAAWTR